MLNKIKDWLLDNSVFILLVVLTVTVMIQGWYIKDCREQLANQKVVIDQLVDAQSKIVMTVMEMKVK